MGWKQEQFFLTIAVKKYWYRRCIGMNFFIEFFALHFAKLCFNFYFYLIVESWNSFSVNFSTPHPPTTTYQLTHPTAEVEDINLDLLIQLFSMLLHFCISWSGDLNFDLQI